MKYYLVAGERSGDLHGANLIKGIKAQDPAAEFRGWGGDMMKAAGMELVTHYRDTAFMGFVEVARNLLTILGLLRKCKRDILMWQPDAIILIDYPGFNLRVARFGKKSGIKVFYYISPKVWAWNQDRALRIKRNVDRMFVIFPFEVDFYKQYDYAVEYVGNPLMDAIASFVPDPDFRSKNNLSGKAIVALLPGSRVQEIQNMLDTMLSVLPYFPDHQFVIAAVKSLPESIYQAYRHFPQVQFVYESTYDLLTVSEAALVTSGTATLETALLNTPEVVCYRTSSISYQVAKLVIKVPFISLTNLISDREIVKELIQDELTTENLVRELQLIVKGGSKRETQLRDFVLLREMVGGPGASESAGERMVAYTRISPPVQ